MIQQREILQGTVSNAISIKRGMSCNIRKIKLSFGWAHYKCNKFLVLIIEENEKFCFTISEVWIGDHLDLIEEGYHFLNIKDKSTSSSSHGP